MMGCKKCMGMCGFLMLLFGVLFLLQDLSIWNFWNINWWTVAFLLMGMTSLAMKSCSDCQAVMYGTAKKK